ncbi:MAG: histidine kinase, partial [Bacteroidota bacterium]
MARNLKYIQWTPTLIHTAVWTFVFCLPAVMFDSGMPTPGVVVAKIFVHHTMLAICFYLNYLYLIPRLLFKRRVWTYVGAAALVVVTILGVNVALTHGLKVPETVIEMLDLPPNAVGSWQLETYPLISSILAMAIGVAIRVTGRWTRMEKAREEAARELLNTELALLKNQINPHFFFNVMNAIYVLVETDPVQA